MEVNIPQTHYHLPAIKAANAILYRCSPVLRSTAIYLYKCIYIYIYKCIYSVGSKQMQMALFVPPSNETTRSEHLSNVSSVLMGFVVRWLTLFLLFAEFSTFPLSVRYFAIPFGSVLFCSFHFSSRLNFDDFLIDRIRG